jgi:pimeloyl-ACP methyl ester carboxylesterase
MTRFDWKAPQPLDIDGARLETATWGPPPDAAPTLVLLHEGLGSVGLWRDLPLKLAAATGFGVFAWSRRGYGRSSSVNLPRPLDYMTHEAVHTLPRVLETLRLPRFALVGHSDGASIAAIYAGAVDDSRLGALALIAPHFFREPESLAAIEAAQRAYAETDLRAKLARHHDDVDGAFFGWSRAWTDPGFAAFNLLGYIENWRVAALMIQGDEDPYGTKAQVDAVAARTRDVETLMLAGCQHAPHFERPTETLEALAGFLRRTLIEA